MSRNNPRGRPTGKSRFERAVYKKPAAEKTVAGKSSLELAAALDAFMSGKNKIDKTSGPYARDFAKLQRAEEYLRTNDRPSKGRNSPRSKFKGTF